MIWLRLPTLAILVVLVLLPVGVVVYQSVLDEPFFAPNARLSLESYAFILGEPDFARAFISSLVSLGRGHQPVRNVDAAELP
jgi:iron(III) transport system permease protein